MKVFKLFHKCCPGGGGGGGGSSLNPQQNISCSCCSRRSLLDKFRLFRFWNLQDCQLNSDEFLINYVNQFTLPPKVAAVEACLTSSKYHHQCLLLPPGAAWILQVQEITHPTCCKSLYKSHRFEQIVCEISSAWKLTHSLLSIASTRFLICPFVQD